MVEKEMQAIVADKRYQSVHAALDSRHPRRPPHGSGRPLPSNDGGNPRRTPAVSTARAIASDRA